MDNTFTDDQRVEMIENQCDHIIALCETYVEGDALQDVGNIRALYEEYGEWLDTYNAMPGVRRSISPLGNRTLWTVPVE